MRLVGPGVRLAATRRGRFVVAVVPKRNREPYQMPSDFVVYHVIPQ